MDTSTQQGNAPPPAEVARRRLVAPWLVAALLALVAGCSSSGHVHHPLLGFDAETSPIQIASVSIGEQNVFIPSTLVVTAGVTQRLSIFNATEKAHGFSIPGLGVEVLLTPAEETVVDLPPLEAGRVFRIHCHLHPAHRNATLVVLPAR